MIMTRPDLPPNTSIQRRSSLRFCDKLAQLMGVFAACLNGQFTHQSRCWAPSSEAPQQGLAIPFTQYVTSDGEDRGLKLLPCNSITTNKQISHREKSLAGHSVWQPAISLICNGEPGQRMPSPL